jgi:OOP family OmpA-OmpF porin
MMKTQKFKLALAMTLMMMAYGCASSVQKADIPSSANPTDEISKLESDISYGESNEFDVLDHDDFKNAKDRLMSAKEKLKDNKEQEDVLDQLRYSRAYYERAKTVSTERKGRLDTVLTARNAALDAGVQKYPNLTDEWNDTEKDARKLSEKKAEDIEAKDVKKLQDRYADLQFKAVKMNYLGNAQAIIKDAKDHDGDDKAEKSYKQAQIDYSAAENAISANRNTPSQFKTEVDRANRSADRLRRVMVYKEKQGKQFNEDAAIQLVMQEDRINHLDNELGTTREELGSSRETNEQIQARMRAQGAKLTAAEREVAMQQAIDSARKEFKPSEADVYQQGDKLLIRMKGLNFATGKSELPKNADTLLSKVESVAKELSAQEILVQGHTDATGSKTKNMKLSEDRAEQVANYFEKQGMESSSIRAEGYGDTTPLTTNKTKTGRAQNRRIDIVITPAGQM